MSTARASVFNAFILFLMVKIVFNFGFIVLFLVFNVLMKMCKLVMDLLMVLYSRAAVSLAFWRNRISFAASESLVLMVLVILVNVCVVMVCVCVDFFCLMIVGVVELLFVVLCLALVASGRASRVARVVMIFFFCCVVYDKVLCVLWW